MVEGLLNALQIDGIQFTRLPEDECTYTRPGHTAQILSNDNQLGLVELNFDHLIPLIKDTIQSKPLPKFPAIFRDITIIVDNDTETQKIVAEGHNQAEALVESFNLLDVFEGKPITEGKKSVSLRVTYRSPYKTLQDEDVTPIHQSIADRLVKAFKASLPA